jgi:hypothetical protein
MTAKIVTVVHHHLSTALLLGETGNSRRSANMPVTTKRHKEAGLEVTHTPFIVPSLYSIAIVASQCPIISLNVKLK